MATAWNEAFSAFCERKTREAIGAATPPYVTELAHPEPPLIGIGNAWSSTKFDGRFYITPPAERARPSCSLGARPWIRTILMEKPDRLDAPFRELRDLGIARISCIGGRTLAKALLQRDLIDDMYVTTAPKRGGEPQTPIPSQQLDATLVVRKRGTAEETGVVFEHFHISRG